MSKENRFGLRVVLIQVERTVILYYDHVVTFDDEYRYIWQNKWSGASCLFFVNRYFAFLAVGVL